MHDDVSMMCFGGTVVPGTTGTYVRTNSTGCTYTQERIARPMAKNEI